MSKKIIVVNKFPNFSRAIARSLKHPGSKIEIFSTLMSAKARLAQQDCNVLICDIGINSTLDGIEILELGSRSKNCVLIALVEDEAAIKIIPKPIKQKLKKVLHKSEPLESLITKLQLLVL